MYISLLLQPQNQPMSLGQTFCRQRSSFHKVKQLLRARAEQSWDLNLGKRGAHCTPLLLLYLRDPRGPSAALFSFPTARMKVYSGLTNKSALLYDSFQTESVPFEGLLSEGNSIRIEFMSDQARAASSFNIRFEGEGPRELPLPWGGGAGSGEAWRGWDWVLGGSNLAVQGQGRPSSQMDSRTCRSRLSFTDDSSYPLLSTYYVPSV